MSELIELLNDVRAGEPAGVRLLPRVYAELRQLAAARLANERPDQTLQPTALVHEAWIRLGGPDQPAWENAGHFFAAAAEAMRRILVDRARQRGRLKRGGGLRRVDLDGLDLQSPSPADDARLLALDLALGAIERTVAG